MGGLARADKYGRGLWGKKALGSGWRKRKEGPRRGDRARRGRSWTKREKTTGDTSGEMDVHEGGVSGKDYEHPKKGRSKRTKAGQTQKSGVIGVKIKNLSLGSKRAGNLPSFLGKETFQISGQKKKGKGAVDGISPKMAP